MALCNLEENACNEIRVIRVAGIDNLGSSCCRLSPVPPPKPPRSLELRQLTRSLAGWLTGWVHAAAIQPASPALTELIFSKVADDFAANRDKWTCQMVQRSAGLF
jgi:hypothetical protein